MHSIVVLSVAHTLQMSENKYMKKLKAIILAYQTPVKDARILTDGEAGSIFRGLTDMRDVHTRLNSVIQAASDDDGVASGMAVLANEFSL